MRNPENEWWDLLLHTGPLRFPYRIQWSMKSGKVRVQGEGTTRWTESNTSVSKAEYALHVGYEILSRR